NRALTWALPISVLVGLGACSSSDPGSEGNTAAPKGSNGSSCTANADCVSKTCQSNVCVGNGQYVPANASCTQSTQCASGICSNGKCAAGQNLPNSFSCVSNAECQSGSCSNGACTTPSNPGAGGQGNGTGAVSVGSQGNVTTTVNNGQSSFTTSDGSAPFQGLGVSWRPLRTGCAPESAGQCGGTCEANAADAKVSRAPSVFCFGADPTGSVQDPTPEDPAAMIEQVIESVNGVSYVHIRVTFDPKFVDNTYGVNSIGWGTKGHTFNSQLTNSDHVELLLTDASGKTVMDFKEDYIHSLTNTKGPGADKPGKPGKAPPGAGGAPATEPTTSAGAAAIACAYDNLGVSGGDGAMVVGSASDVLAATSSIDRNINGCGYCANSACGSTGDCSVDSPQTDEKYTPNPLTPNWNYAVVYEVWLRAGAFDAGGGFGQAYITFVHASPSKLSGDTLNVVPSPCPPTWIACPPGQSCPPNPPSGSDGTGGTGNVPNEPGCPVNYQVYITLEGASTCAPIPFAGWPERAACPAGYKYTIDTSNETQYCLPG
ncbi:MAG TPA: hypothetical protein VKP30_33085, partial [Polyangiaceae bacterium]|nr:hypothetical protein [Polyangiaceae bacterium]